MDWCLCQDFQWDDGDTISDLIDGLVCMCQDFQCDDGDTISDLIDGLLCVSGFPVG